MKRKQLEIKTRYILAGVALVFIILLARISFLQLVQTEQYRTLARNNYIRIVPVFAPRGEIFDRNGEKMVTNRPIYTVSINDINIKGTTYSVVLERIGADTVQMAEQMARILAGDPEYLRRAGEGIKADGDPDDNARLIMEQIKADVRDNKTELENGRPLVLAEVYDPDVAAALTGQPWDAYGIRVDKHTDMLSRLVALLFPKGVFEEESAYQVEQRIRNEIREKKAYESVLVAEDIPMDTVVELREKQLELPGVVVDIQPTRDYPYDQLMSHALGYVQNIKPEQYEEHKDEGYLMNDLYGQNGLEIMFESYLRGEHGARQVEVDTYNRPVRDLGLKQPVPGSDLVLTVDLEVQKAAEKALAEGVQRARNAGHDSRAGAAVAIDVNSGAVLAIASYPSYNPGVFANLTNAKWQELQDSGALLNRAISTYAPGSTFKMVTAAAILEEEVVDPSYRMPDPGYFMLGRRYNDWKAGGHGSVDMLRALQYSCDTYFWRYGLMAGEEAIAHYAREFGLGQLTGIGLPGEMAGVVPNPEHKYEVGKTLKVNYNPDFAKVRELNDRIEQIDNELKKIDDNTGERSRLEQEKKKLESEREQELAEKLKMHEWELEWQAYDTLNMSIGQGDNLYTPLQLASYVATIANGGTLYKPYLVERVVSPGGELIEEFDKQVRHRVDIKPENLKIIQEGMHLVALPPAGTAATVFYGAKYSAAAKTGTAEVYDEFGNKKYNHALFVAYAPYEKPEVAVAVFLDQGHSGSGFAGPIGRNILDAYFGEEVKSLLPPGQAEELENNKQEQGAGNRADTWERVSDDTPALAWPGWTKQSAGLQGEDERFRYYEHRLKRWQDAQQAAAARPAAGSRPTAPPPDETQRQEPPQAEETQPQEPPPADGTPPPSNQTPPGETGPDVREESPQPGDPESPAPGEQDGPADPE